MSAKPTKLKTNPWANRLASSLSAREKRELANLVKMPDSAIDTSDIPEISDWAGAQVGRFYRPKNHGG